MMNVEQLKTLVLPIVKATRTFTKPNWGKIDCSYKNDNAASALTEIDIQVEEFLQEHLTSVLPEIAFVGEETGGDNSAQTRWLCDPIDGTGIFVRGLHGCTTMLSLIKDDKVIAAVIYDFVADDIYYAVKGEGAYKNKTQISVNDRPLNQAYIAEEINEADPEIQDTRKRLVQETMTTKNINAGYDFIKVAEGKLDGRVSHKPFGQDYDYAPGLLIVQEAGGVVTNIGSRTYDYKNLSTIAASPVVHAALTEGPNAIYPVK
jgi:myo-inositol-1(or 4)-monophosphatase